MKMKKEIMTSEQLERAQSLKDLSDPANGIHAINIVIQKIQEVLQKTYPNDSIEIYRTSPIVSIAENFDNLYFPQDNIGRSSVYTRYVSNDHVLRTHTSAGILSWLKQNQEWNDPSGKIILMPGICYRRDVVDKTHTGAPHQMDIWRIKQGGKPFSADDLVDYFLCIINAIIPGYEYRANITEHPYTTGGREIELLINGKWVEIMECGIISSRLLKDSNLDPEIFSGLAAGMGIDRFVMIAKKIDDIRILRSTDPHISSQMKDLKKYRPISSQPMTKRVLSYSASLDKSEEDICETIREALGENICFLEEIKIEEVSYDNLEAIAIERLGISPSQKNVVATLTFRSIDRSFPRERVNEWVQTIYPLLNEGSGGYM